MKEVSSNSNSSSEERRAIRYICYIDLINQDLSYDILSLELQKISKVEILELKFPKKDVSGKITILDGYGLIEAKHKRDYDLLFDKEIFIQNFKIFIEPFDLETDSLESQRKSFLSRSVIASGFLDSFTLEKVKELFQRNFGVIYSINQFYKKTSLKEKKFYFIVFNDPESAKKCLDTHILIPRHSYPISVERFDPENPESRNKKVRILEFENEKNYINFSKKEKKIAIKSKSSSFESSNGIKEQSLGTEEEEEEENSEEEEKMESGEISITPLSIGIDHSGSEENYFDDDIQILEPRNQESITLNTRNIQENSSSSSFNDNRSLPFSPDFRQFYREMEEALREITQETPYQAYEDFYNFTQLYQNFNLHYPILQEMGLSDEEDHGRKEHLKKNLVRRIEKNHDRRNLRFNVPRNFNHKRAYF